jgi:putative glutamine amidotransferase
MRPVILVSACNRMLDGEPTHALGRAYTAAVRLAGGIPLVVPDADLSQIDALLDVADGVLLTGSPSNVDPRHYGKAVHDERLPLDPSRDAWTLPLARRAIARGVPLFAICRGLQEVNVAFGGTLHQAVHEVAGLDDHRTDEQLPVDAQYAAAHVATPVRGGLLESIVGGEPLAVNSLHGQGIERLADGLRVEAVAPDGLIEACTVVGAKAFALCVQWHPEWNAHRDPVSMRLLTAFGAACEAHRVANI